MGRNQAIADVLDYDPEEDKWTKVDQLAKGRYKHAMSLVPKETADYCVWSAETVWFQWFILTFRNALYGILLVARY